LPLHLGKRGFSGSQLLRIETAKAGGDWTTGGEKMMLDLVLDWRQVAAGVEDCLVGDQKVP
jgi:hypothetical protein